MKQRPRQIDASKPVLTVSSLEAFNSAEGQEVEIKNTEQIITPDQLMKEKGVQKRLEFTIHQCEISFLAPPYSPLFILYYTHYYLDLNNIKSPHSNHNFHRDVAPVYPDATTYELTDEDLHFLSTINEKLQIPISIEDFEQYLALLDAKSGKDVEIDFSEFLKLKPNLPTTISQQMVAQEQLYNYFKKQRQNFSRSLTRFLMHPYYEDNNPHLAFRPRTQPMDRTMKLRRGNAQNTRGANEMETVGQKIVFLKKDLLLVSNIIDQSIQREKAMEIERRFNFCKFIKEFFDSSKKEKDNNAEIRLWSKDCFVRECLDKCQINIVEKADEMFDNISKEILQWRELNEKQKREKQRKEDQILKFEKQIEDLIADKSKFEEKPPVIPPVEIVQPIVQQLPPQIPIIPQEPPDDKMESVAKFLATLYLEARKYQLTFDQVLSDTFPIYKIQNTQQQVNSKSIFPFSLMQIEGTDIVYKVRKDRCLEKKNQAYWESYQDQQLTSTLYYQHQYFKEKVNDIMEMADMDQMVYSLGIDDDKQDEEEKLFKKKVKSNSTRLTGTNGGQLK